MNWLFRSSATVLVIFSQIFVFTNEANAKIKLTVGDPTKNGSIDITLGFNNGTQTFKSVPILGSFGEARKAAEIAENLLTADPIGVVVARMPPNMMTFQKEITGINIDDSSGETTMLAAVDGQIAKKGQIDGRFLQIEPSPLLAPSLSGLDGDGNESTFVASLGFETPSESVFASSNLLFSQLGGNDIDNWLSTIFTDLQGQLPVAYQPNLSLDLNSDEISFVFPDNILPSTGFISNGTTDTAASASLGLTATERVPEPTSTLSLLALGTLGAASTLKRKLKPSKTSEKETTKVS